MLLPSLAVVDRIIAIELAYTVARMLVLERIPGNPIGIAFLPVGDRAMALASRFLPAFSRVVGLKAGDEAHVGPIVAWYREQGIQPTFEAVPGHFTEALGQELARYGLAQSGFHTALAAKPAAMREPAVNVQRVMLDDDMERYLDAYSGGWELPGKDHAQFKANVRPWRHEPGWQLRFIEVDGRPAAAGTLFIHDGAGYLADAATVPQFRGRGLHAALLARRITDATVAGCDLVCSGAAPLSTSHRNMERAGLRIAFQRALWRPL